MASVRFAICVTEQPVKVKDPLWVWTADGKATLLPSAGFEDADLAALQERVIQEVMATFKAFSARNKKTESEPVKVLPD